MKNDVKNGIYLAIICLAIYIYELIFGGNNEILKMIILAFLVIILLITFLFPSLLGLVIKKWIMLGDLIGKITGPIVLIFLFYILITPVAIILRVFGRDELCIRKIERHSYWKIKNNDLKLIDKYKKQY